MRARWKEFLLALVMAFSLWYGMSGTEIVESQVEVRVDYKGIPDNVVFDGDGLVSRVVVRVRGPAGQIRAMSMRNYVFAMDLSSLRKGVNVLPIDISSVGLFGALQVIDVTPSSLRLNVDLRDSKEVPLKAELIGDVGKDLAVEVTFTPNRVVINGPSQILSDIEELIVPLDLGTITEPDVLDLLHTLVLPDMVEAVPAEVLGSARIDLKRTVLQVVRKVQADPPRGAGIFVRPDQITIKAALPLSMVEKAAENRQIRAFVTLPDSALGSYTLPVRVALPEGALLVGIDPSETTVTIEQINP